MHKLILLNISLLYFFLTVSCTNETKKNLPQDSPNIEQKEKDSIVIHYEQLISDYYKKMDSNDYEIVLQIDGRKEYEDDAVLILTFNEVLEYGSWHYTESSLFFLKKDTQLLPIAPSTADLKILNEDFHEKALQYPNRISGQFKEKIDLTGDGIPEYIFYSTGIIRTNIEEAQHVYQLNLEQQRLEITNVSTSGNGFVGECDTTIGQLSDFNFIQTNSTCPIIEVKTVEKICMDSILKAQTIDSSKSYYQWNPQSSRFEKLDYENAFSKTIKLDLNHNLTLEIVDEAHHGDLMVAHLSSDTVTLYSDAYFSLSSTPFKLISQQLNSIQVAQARLEYIAISQPPSDGFDEAILANRILQSDWVAYNVINDIYLPFSQNDARFDIKNKPKLSKQFITKLLSKSGKKRERELLQGFKQSNSLANWVNCTNIIRIKILN